MSAYGKLLVVEDEPQIRALTALVARRAGFVVDVAKDGLEALDLLATADYVLVMLDLTMPRLSGFEVIDALALKPKRPAVIVLTAMESARTSQLDPRVVHAILRKPFDVEMLGALMVDVALAASRDREGQSLQEPGGHDSVS